MTYCCGILVRDGLVMFADTRTNAGVDNIATFRKLHVLIQPGQRIMAIATAGNLSISQSVVSILREGWENPDTGETETLMNAPTLFQAAQRVGRTVRQLYDLEGKALEASDVKFDVSFLLGGQIKGERPRLFMLYAAGNFIECTQDTPYLQIGEHKYGKPVLDRAITYDIDLYDALKVGLVSVDSTMRSNLSVGTADRCPHCAARCLRCRAQFSDRTGRTLFSRPARTLVGGAAGRACRHSAPSLQEYSLSARRNCRRRTSPDIALSLSPPPTDLHACPSPTVGRPEAPAVGFVARIIVEEIEDARGWTRCYPSDQVHTAAVEQFQRIGDIGCRRAFPDFRRKSQHLGATGSCRPRTEDIRARSRAHDPVRCPGRSA